MRLSGYGDADMINIFDEGGERLLPVRAAQRLPVGREVSVMMRDLRATYFIPFSSMHRYQRSDSAWANEHTTGLARLRGLRLQIGGHAPCDCLDESRRP